MKRESFSLLIAVLCLTMCPVRAQSQTQDALWQTYIEVGVKAYSEDHAAAMAMFRSALKEAEALPPRDPRLVITLQVLAAASADEGSHSEAETFTKRAAAISPDSFSKAGASNSFNYDDLDIASDLNTLADQLYNKDKYAESRPLYHLILLIREKARGLDHLDTAIVLNTLADLCVRLKDPTAEEFYKRELAIRQDRLGKDAADALVSEDLGDLYGRQNKPKEAEQCYLDALTIREHIFGSDDVKIEEDLQKLGRFYYNQGRYEKAEPMFNRAVKVRLKAYGEDNSDVMSNRLWLAATYRLLHKYKEAASLFEKVVNYNKKKNPSNRYMVSVLALTALNYYDNASYQKAREIYEEALDIQERISGVEHPDLTTLLTDLANTYNAMDKPGKAESFHQRVLAICEKQSDKEPSRVASALENLAGFYSFREDYGKCESFYKRALEQRQKANEQQTSQFAVDESNLGVCYQYMNRHADAAEFAGRALTLRKQIFKPAHAAIAVSLNNLAKNRYYLNEYDVAEPLYKEVLQIAERLYNRNDANYAWYLKNYALLQYAQGRRESAETNFSDALKVLQESGASLQVALSLYELAELFHSQGKYADADKYYRRAMDARLKWTNSGRPNPALILERHAVLLRKLDREAEGAEMERRAKELRAKATQDRQQ